MLITGEHRHIVLPTLYFLHSPGEHRISILLRRAFLTLPIVSEAWLDTEEGATRIYNEEGEKIGEQLHERSRVAQYKSMHRERCLFSCWPEAYAVFSIS